MPHVLTLLRMCTQYKQQISAFLKSEDTLVLYLQNYEKNEQLFAYKVKFIHWFPV